ncbi:MAG: hypothetical protein EBX94_02360, partial [Burkholderiaceae bacterium]|nr:hypothetical protein [Burkholderiaceae bacterium]
GFLESKPDLVVSGINQGENMGEDVLYSGTVAAAIEGVMFGVPGIAFSQVDRGWAQIDDAAKAARDIVTQALQEPMEPKPTYRHQIQAGQCLRGQGISRGPEQSNTVWSLMTSRSF